MPSKSKKQRRFMAAAANNPKFAKKVGIKQSVAKEFHKADKKKFARGGLATAVRPMLENRLTGRAGPLALAGGMRGMPPGRASGAQTGFPPKGGYRPSGPVKGPLQAAQGRFGAAGAPQRPPMGRSRIMGRIPGRQQNSLLRSADTAVNRAGDRIGRMGVGMRRFAKGGKVSKALEALNEARDWLIHSSDDPEFGTALTLLKNVPDSAALKSRIRKARSVWRNENASDDEISKTFKELDKALKEHRTSLSGSKDD